MVFEIFFPDITILLALWYITEDNAETVTWSTLSKAFGWVFGNSWSWSIKDFAASALFERQQFPTPSWRCASTVVRPEMGIDRKVNVPSSHPATKFNHGTKTPFWHMLWQWFTTCIYKRTQFVSSIVPIEQNQNGTNSILTYSSKSIPTLRKWIVSASIFPQSHHQAKW